MDGWGTAVDGGGRLWTAGDGGMTAAAWPSFFLDSKSDVREIYPEDSISFFYSGFAHFHDV